MVCDDRRAAPHKIRPGAPPTMDRRQDHRHSASLAACRSISRKTTFFNNCGWFVKGARRDLLERRAWFRMSGAPIYFQAIWGRGPGPRSGSDCVFIKNQSEPDFGPGLPVRPTNHESVGLRPEPGPSAFLRFVAFLKKPLAVGSERWRAGPKPGPSSRNLGICCTRMNYSFFVIFVYSWRCC